MDIEAAFEEFHAENPAVYAELRSLSLMLRGKGRSIYGIDALMAVLRFNRSLSTTGEEFKINNNFAALYSRRLMENEPELQGFFRTRSRKGEQL